MADNKEVTVLDPEISAIAVVYSALKALEPDAQSRVIDYVAGKLGISRAQSALSELKDSTISYIAPHASSPPSPSLEGTEAVETDGINAIAQKWMKRNNLSVAQLLTIYSLGGDEIDLIAKSIPGESKRQRLRNVLLLKGIAAYLGGGAARVSHEQLKETCLHYDAFDSPNFAANIKSLGSEVSGTKQSGYTLTQRGLAAATDLIKAMLPGHE